MVKGEAKLYPAVFIGWVILPGSTVTRDSWVLPWSKLQKALRILQSGSTAVSGTQNSQTQELDDFEGELESEIEDKNSPVEEVSGMPKLDYQPAALRKTSPKRLRGMRRLARWVSCKCPIKITETPLHQLYDFGPLCTRPNGY
eukprot:6288797-Amphidinium_carterae.3